MILYGLLTEKNGCGMVKTCRKTSGLVHGLALVVQWIFFCGSWHGLFMGQMGTSRAKAAKLYGTTWLGNSTNVASWLPIVHRETFIARSRFPPLDRLLIFSSRGEPSTFCVQVGYLFWLEKSSPQEPFCMMVQPNFTLWWQLEESPIGCTWFWLAFA